jgi:hypothetical protein
VADDRHRHPRCRQRRAGAVRDRALISVELSGAMLVW